MSIIVVGLNHKTAPLEVREKISFPETTAPLHDLIKINNIDEGAILSTCNRVEICVSTKDMDSGIKSVSQFMLDYHQVTDDVAKHFYLLKGEAAIHHTFRVASSLDSLVIGEPQILGQVKEAYFRAKDAQTLGPVLHKFYHRTFGVAKRVRRETAVGTKPVSVGSVAIDLSKKIFDSLKNKVILLVGAGEMIEMATTRLIEQGVTQFYIANRTRENVVRLAHAFHDDVHFRYLPLSDMPKCIDKVDMILVSTASPNYLLTKDMMIKSMKRRKNKPIFCIDISVPRNVDPAINDVDNIYLYDIDDLKNIVTENYQKREKEAKQAEKIVLEEARQFYVWINALKFKPTMKSIRQKVETIRKEELDVLKTHVKNITEDDLRHIEKFSERLTNKILHDPFVSIREDMKRNNIGLLDTLRKLFRLSNE